MKKFIAFEKLSKKKQRECNADKRRDWGVLNPITRTPPNSKTYDRNKEKAIRRRNTDSLCCMGNSESFLIQPSTVCGKKHSVVVKLLTLPAGVQAKQIVDLHMGAFLPGNV